MGCSVRCCDGERKCLWMGVVIFVWDNLCCRERFFYREFRVERKKCGEVVVGVGGGGRRGV